MPELIFREQASMAARRSDSGPPEPVKSSLKARWSLRGLTGHRGRVELSV